MWYSRAMNEDTVLTPKKRGPKPIGDEPMTAAERKRRSRARQITEGTRAEFTVSLSGGPLEFVDQMAQHNNVSRSRVVHEVLEMAIALVRNTAFRADQMLSNGASMEEVERIMSQAFRVPDQRITELEREPGKTE